jgi:MFS family permease
MNGTKVQSRPGPVLAAFGVSSLGDGMRTAALPLLAVTVTTDPVAVAAIAVFGRLPWILVALFSGAIADRYDRRALMVAVDLCRALVVIGLVAFIISDADHLVLLYAVALLLGIGETLFDTATQGLLPQVVPKENLGKANGNLFTLNLVAGSFAGPPLGGWLFSIGRIVPFLVDAATFAVAAILVAVHRVTLGPAPQEHVERQSILADVGEGLRWVRDHDLIRSFVAVSTVVNFTQSAIQSVLVLLATQVLGLSPAGFGILLTASGVGGFVAGVLSSRIGGRLGVPRVLFPAIMLTIPLFVLIALANDVYTVAAAIGLNAFFGVMASVQMAVLRQRIVPNRLLSRVSSVGQFFSFGFAIPAGALAAGLIAQVYSVRTVYFLAAGVVGVLCLAVASQLRPSNVRSAIQALDSQ